MDKKDCFYLGKITKPVGLDGELVVFFDVDDIGHYKQLDAIFVDLNNSLIPFFVETMKSGGAQKMKVKFENVNSEADAREICNAELYLPLELLPKLKGNKFYYHEIADFEVVDKTAGSIGKVEQVLDYPNNPLIEVRHINGEVLVPISDEVILNVDRAKKTIQINLPEGLLDINL